MRSLHIIPGSGGNFYCQNCLRDNILVKTLRQQGEEAVAVPLYLPMFTDDPDTEFDSPVFFPAISLYLKYKFPFLKWLPGFVDSSFLLKKAAKKAGSTKADGLEGMTISMLEGEGGGMNEELNKMIKWASEIEKPDILHISNALLLGIAGPIKKALDIPVVCSLQDEKQWLDSIKEPFRTQIWELMAEKARDVDMFISVSDYYAQEMKKNMKIPDEKLTTVHIGIDLNGYDTDGKRKKEGFAKGGVAIGYLSKIALSMGFGTLVDAFIAVKKEKDFENLKLIATGGLLEDSKAFICDIRKKLAKYGFEKDLEIQDNFDSETRKEFFRSIDLLSVPVPGGEAFGTYMIESMASGVPVVQPEEGAFSEIVEKTGGGVIYSPNDSHNLADAIKGLLRNPKKMNELGEKGRETVFRDFSIEKMAEEITDIYRGLTLDA